MSSSPTMALHQFSLPQAGTERAGYWRTFPIGSTHFMEVINSSKSARTRGGDISASGDETHTKVRKPYTITKQRERWTEEEHQKFLEALKLYGRAWRRIEEHIGSKTAVQIRSHAQKFFSKLEREASTGILAGLAQDIEIPPPRPKRKPNHPYPRKAGSTFSSSLAFEEDEKSSPDDCSDLTALTSPTALGLMPTQVKITRYSPSFTQGSFLTRETSNMQKEESFGSPRKNGSPTSLKLFGQTFTVPESQRADSFEVGTLQLSGKPKVSSSSTESESADSPRSQVLRKDMRFRTLSSPCSCTNENDSKESFVANVQSKGRLENDTSMDLSEMENPSSSLLESAVGAMESVSHSCYSSEEDKSWKHDSEACTEECMHSAFQSLDEDNHTEDSNSHNKVNESNYSYLGTNTSAPFANANRQFFNSMASLCRFPCSPLDNLSKDQENNQEAPPSCSPSQHQVYGGFENLSESIGERGQDGAKSSFTPWHLSKTATQQNSAIFATPFWPGFVPATSAIHKFGEDAGTAAAIAAASFAAASAWWALQGAVPSGGVHSNMGELCSPVAVYAASRRPLSISSTSSFESGALAKGQDLNQNKICDIGNMTGDSEHKQGDLRHDKPETSFKTAELPLGYSYMGTSPPRCYSSSENIVAGFYSESSSCDTDFLPAKKRLRSSSADVDASGEESKNSFSGSNTPPADTSFDDSEKSGDENVNLPLGYYFVSAQLSRTSSFAEEKCKSTTSLESQNPIVHSTSNSNAPSDRLQDGFASAGREEKDRGIPQNHGFQRAKENQISNSNGDYGMCAENVQLVEAYDQDDHKLSLQNQAVCPPVSMAEEESQSFVSIEMPSFDQQGKCHGLMCGGTTKEALSKISRTIDSQECNMPTESSELDSTVVPSCLQEGNAGDDQKVAERCSVVRSSFAKDLQMALNTEKDGNNEDSSHVWPSQGRMDAMDEGKRRSSAVVNIGGLVGSQRYSGVGFVPYQRSL